jgi:hypothetical protein
VDKRSRPDFLTGVAQTLALVGQPRGLYERSHRDYRPQRNVQNADPHDRNGLLVHAVVVEEPQDARGDARHVDECENADRGRHFVVNKSEHFLKSFDVPDPLQGLDGVL